MAKLKKELCLSEMLPSLNARIKAKQDRNDNYLNTFPEPDEKMTNNTILIQILNHNKNRRKPRFCNRSKIPFFSFT